MSERMAFRVEPSLPGRDLVLGGKAANVCRLAAIAGIRIPRSAVLDARAFLRFARASFSDEEMGDLVRAYRMEDQRGPLFARLAHAPFPADLVTEITSVCPRKGLLIVRSSGTAEDSATTSLAGHYESILTRTARKDLLFAIKGCWLVGLRVFLDHVLPPPAPEDSSEDWPDLARRALTSVALLFQEVVEALSSGVYFSRSPVHPDRSLVVANWGTCHSCVDGRMPTDCFVLDQGRLESRVVRHKFEMTVFSDAERPQLPGSTVHTPLGPTTVHFPYGEMLYSARVPSPLDGSPALTTQDLVALDDAARRVREAVEHEIDMEWSFDAAGLVVLQVRPITTTPPETRLGGEDAEFVVASGGVAVGPVRVVLSPRDVDRVREGDVIAVQATDPDYMPILYRCSAVLSEEGSPLCHTAIVARELGIPCLLGVKGATTGSLREGETVTVDGSRGRILHGEEATPPPPPGHFERNAVVYDLGHVERQASSGRRTLTVSASALLHRFALENGWTDPTPRALARWAGDWKNRHGVGALRVHWDLCDDRNVPEEADPNLLALRELSQGGTL